MRGPRFAICLLLVTAAVSAIAPGGSVAAASRATAAAGHPTKFTVYSVAKEEQFIDNNDDESRGDVNNPFSIHDRSASQAIEEHSNGPFPGDEAVFTFTLYTKADLKQKAGSAVFTCLYYVAKHAFCDASFQFAGGAALVGSGAFAFDATKYALAITGGLGPYDGRTGDVEALAGARLAQRLDFDLE